MRVTLNRIKIQNCEETPISPAIAIIAIQCEI